jgi:DNA mismatch repair protein MutS2
MNLKYLETLELDKILNRLAEHSAFSAGRELALALRPSTDADQVRLWQAETNEAKSLLSVLPGITLGGARDVRPLLKSAEINALLDPQGLLDIHATLVSARTLKRSIPTAGARSQVTAAGAKVCVCPTLGEVAQRIAECPKLVAEIERCVSSQGEVVDSASPALSRIRRQLAAARDRVLERLSRLLTSSDSAGYLQEALITQRGGRYVVPIKAEFKGRVQGIVHDQSASGATLFIEPLAIVELGNQWRELQLEEQREVERILRELTALVAGHVVEIRSTVEALAQLDLAFAKAQYAFALKASEPALLPASGKQYLRLIRARHPLLASDSVVPIDVELGGDFSILVVTGPNTGGKTVALKTVGLLAVMAQCGLQIPAMEGSGVRVFQGVYADIGDEQSIEQSLSTFSSHIGNIITILAEADEGSLVLLDELGAGTDPTEGSALARAILSQLLLRKIPAMATTHYAELKLYAQATPGVENAAVEFDVATLSPTYRLTVGLPGRSNAFAIARRLGLPQTIIDQAQGLISSEDLEADRLLERVRQSRHELGRATSAAQTALSAAREKDKEARRLVRETERERNELLVEARSQLEEVTEELARVRKVIEHKGQSKEWLDEAHRSLQRLEEKQKTLEPPPVSARVATASAREQLANGDTVWVASLGQIGQVVQVLDAEAEVQIGLFRAKIPLLQLEKRPAAALPPLPSRVHVSLAPRPLPSLELHLRGQRVEDILPRLNKHLDDAYLAGLPFVRIVHGKGTGTLRQVVRETLAEHPLVVSFRPGELNEGGEGVTVAKLAPRSAE